MPGWAILATVVAVCVGGVALAWWSSGRARRHYERPMSETEKDYLSRNTWRGGTSW